MSETAVEFRGLGEASDLADGGVNPYYLEGSKRRVSVARVGGTLYAFDDLCTCGERSCPLSSGLPTGAALMCQCHGSQLDIASGAVLRGPAAEPLRRYEVREENGGIEVLV